MEVRTQLMLIIVEFFTCIDRPSVSGSPSDTTYSNSPILIQDLSGSYRDEHTLILEIEHSGTACVSVITIIQTGHFQIGRKVLALSEQKEIQKMFLLPVFHSINQYSVHLLHGIYLQSHLQIAARFITSRTASPSIPTTVCMSLTLSTVVFKCGFDVR